MISFFRRLFSSWITLGLLGLVAVAIVVTGVGTPSGLGDIGSAGGSKLVEAGDRAVTTDDLSSQLQQVLQRERDQRPGFDMAGLIRAGGFESVLRDLENYTALMAFGEANGMAVSRKLVDGEIASIPAFQGATGQFDDSRFRQALSSQRLSEAQFRSDLERAIFTRHLLVPVSASPGTPATLTLPYASLMLERRTGSVIAVSSSAAAGAPPTDAEVQTFYTRNVGRYTVPELRSVRYTSFDRARFEGKVVPTGAEIAAFYQKNAARFAARDLRRLTQIIVQDQAAATAIAAKVKAGAAMSDAAKAAGFEALPLEPIAKAAFAGQSAPAVADAAFALPQGGVTAPVKSGFGWHVVKVDAVQLIPGKSIDQVRPEILAELGKAKIDDALAKFDADLVAAVDDGKSFDEIAKQFGLTVATSPAVTGGGIAPSDPNFRATPVLAAVLKAAFQAEQGDDPESLQLSATDYAFYVLDRVTPSAPRPLAAIRDQVARDAAADKASKAARKLAEAVAQAANKGTPFAQAASAAGVRSAPQTLSAQRQELMARGAQIPPPVTLMFNMSARRAKVIEMPGKAGWFVVWLDRIEEGDARTNIALLQQTQRELADMIGQEYSEQFATAVKAQIGVARNKDAIAALKRQLGGSGTR